MKWMVRIFLLIGAVGVVLGHFGVALLSFLFGLFCQWAKEQFETQEYIYGTQKMHKDFHESSMLSYMHSQHPDLDACECEASKAKL